MTGQVVLLAGPAGAGKSTLARAWCSTREVAAHVPLDDVRELIVQGRVDPRHVGAAGQEEQWLLAVRSTCALARTFADADVDVVIDDVLAPGDAVEVWAPLMTGLPTSLVVVLPDLDTVLARGRARAKRVPEDLVREQHADSGRWPGERVLDTTGRAPRESLDDLLALLGSGLARWP